MASGRSGVGGWGVGARARRSAEPASGRRVCACQSPCRAGQRCIRALRQAARAMQGQAGQGRAERQPGRPTLEAMQSLVRSWPGKESLASSWPCRRVRSTWVGVWADVAAASAAGMPAGTGSRRRQAQHRCRRSRQQWQQGGKQRQRQRQTRRAHLAKVAQALLCCV